jgi:hypothetical protein
MFIFSFYRFYIALIVGLATFFLLHSILISIAAAIALRAFIFLVENIIHSALVKRDFAAHSFEFKQLMGPYGIRLINKAETDSRIRNSLAEVFTSDIKKLSKTVENLEVMNKLFSAGLTPDQEEYNLNDLKLKYGKYRLEKCPSLLAAASSKRHM